jgi:hypothetical protein
MLVEGKVADAYALDVGLTRTFLKEGGGGNPPGHASNSPGHGAATLDFKEVDHERPLL